MPRRPTAATSSYQLWASHHHGLLGAVGAGAVALLGLLAARTGTRD
ncbi:MAG TPA: hypothetical protein VE709_04395 [Pseudonocardiaceae bacterium]|nr:hypothetical protein [Pseudonocardiaceae bacterium]